MTGKKNEKHEAALQEDLDLAFHNLDADAVFLSECGEIEYGLRQDLWMDLLSRIVPARFTSIIHQSHYTSIVDESRLKILVGPTLKGPMTNLPSHYYRMCQYLEIKRKDSADKPIQVFNVHCPSSKRRNYGPQARDDVVNWLKNKARLGVIGGDLNFSVVNLKMQFNTQNVNGVQDKTSPYNILFEE